jgi:F-type H+-transporting ATPase subunit epsilon
MKLTVYSPEKAVFDGDVELVELPGAKGRFVVLQDHDSIISTLVKGNIRYKQNGEEKLLPIQSGYVEVNHNVISACVHL